MADDRYLLHHRSEIDVDAEAQRLFAQLDDHRRLASDMENPSLMMVGATLRVETDGLTYAAWCTRRMANDAVTAFAGVPDG